MKFKYFLLILLPVFIILMNFQLLIFNDNFYDDEVSENLLSYFKGEELKFNYTEKELIHLEDVKNLISILKIVLCVLILLISLILIFNKNISNMLIMSGLITIGFIILLFFMDFNLLFTKFHEILFTNDYWLLDSDTLLIRTYPLEFFSGLFKRLILNIIITSLILVGIGTYVHTQYKSSAL